MQGAHDVWQLFGIQSKRIRLHFKLKQIDVAKLASLTQPEYSKIENGSARPGLDKLQNIAQVYGLNYWELANPHLDFPSIHTLPSKVQKLLEDVAPDAKLYKKIDLAHHMEQVLNRYRPDEEFLPSEIFGQLSEDIKAYLGSSVRITHMLKTNFAEQVVKSGKITTRRKAGRPEEYYKLKVSR